MLLININQRSMYAQQGLKQQLKQMGFSESAVDQVLKIAMSKEEAVNLLIAKQSMDAQKQQMGDDGDFQQEDQNYKMVFVVRNDLKMPLGKIAELVATGALSAYKKMEAQIDKNQIKEVEFYEWCESGHRKIVVKANGEKELMDLLNKVRKETDINWDIVKGLPSLLKGQEKEAKNSKKRKDKQKEIEIEKEEKEDKKEKDNHNKKEQIYNKNEVEIISQTKVESKQEAKHTQQQQSEVIAVVVFGPVAQSVIDPMTKHLKLL